MPVLRELSGAVKERRAELGLSQQRIAELTGLSRATINALESGRLTSLSLDRAERVANEVGLALHVSGSRVGKKHRGLSVAAQTASVSFSKALPERELEHSLLHGVVLPAYLPQLKALLDEVPIAVLADAVADIERKHGVRRNATWERMRRLARALGCHRPIWNTGG